MSPRHLAWSPATALSDTSHDAAFHDAAFHDLASQHPVLAQIPDVLPVLPIRILLIVGILLVGAGVSYLVVSFNRRLLERLGVPEAIEGTAFERSAREFGTSTVNILAQLSGYFTFLVFVVVTLTTLGVRVSGIWTIVVAFLPQVFVAILVIVLGLVVGDKVGVFVDERLRSVKIPEVGILPALAKWSVVYVAALVALAQVRVATSALLVLLGAYAFALVVLPAIAFRDLLASASAGVYLLLTEPYAIGDRVRIGGVEGVVQEMDVFATRVESDGEEYLVPNRKAMTEGVVRIRE